MKHVIIAPSLLLLFLLVGNTPVGAVTLSRYCASDLFSDESLRQKTEQLSINERLFLKVHCEALIQGEYIINTQWMDERGMLRSEREHTFKLGLPRSYSAIFKFKQMPMGSLNRLASGKDFDEYQYGRWSVLIFINGEEIDRKYFTIAE